MYKCPICDSTSLAMECQTWVNVEDGYPESFDEADAEEATILFSKGQAVCRDCQHYGAVTEFYVTEGTKS